MPVLVFISALLTVLSASASGFFSSSRAGDCPPSATWTKRIVKADRVADGANSGNRIRVAVLDSGIDRDHPAFRGVRITGADFAGGNENKPYPFFDNEGHGTHVAGIIAGRDCNGNVIGYSPNVELFVARVCGAEGCRSQDIGEGIRWAIARRVDVINISIEGEKINMTAAEGDAVKAAIDAGISVVTISGNGGDYAQGNHLATIDGVIGVGAVNEWGERSIFSKMGETQTLAAPGVNILSAYPQGTGFVVRAWSGGYSPQLIHLLNTPRLGSAKLYEPLVFAAYGAESDFLKTEAGGKIAVVETGGDIDVGKKIHYAEKTGVKALIILVDRKYFASGVSISDNVKLPVFFAERNERTMLIALASSGTRMNLETPVADYIVESGTSMAAPFVTGAIARIRSLNRNLSPHKIKDILVRSAIKGSLNRPPTEDNPFGAGILNLEEALKLAF